MADLAGIIREWWEFYQRPANADDPAAIIENLVHRLRAGDVAGVDVLDGIVTLELSLDVRHEIPDVVACLRAGALAWLNSPTRGIEEAFRTGDVDHVLDVAQEIEDEARRVHDQREAAYTARAKLEAKEARARARAAK